MLDGYKIIFKRQIVKSSKNNFCCTKTLVIWFHIRTLSKVLIYKAPSLNKTPNNETFIKFINIKSS